MSYADKGAVGLIPALELASLTLELDSTSEHRPPWTLLNLLSHHKSTLGRWSSQLLATSIYSRALGLRGLCSQLGTAGGSVVPSLGIATET